MVHLVMAISGKQTRFLNLYQKTKHAIHATEKFVENVINKIPF